MASSLWSSLRSLLGLTSNWQRKSSSWVFGLTSTSQLQQFVPSGYLVAEWGHASPSVLCSDDHPAYVHTIQHNLSAAGDDVFFSGAGLGRRSDRVYRTKKGCSTEGVGIGPPVLWSSSPSFRWAGFVHCTYLQAILCQHRHQMC